MNVRSNGMLWLMLFVILALTTACGGGSGSGGSNNDDGIEALTYSGNENPAAIDSTNIEELTKGAMGLNLVGSDADDVMPSALSRSLSISGLTDKDAAVSATQPMVRSLSDGVTRSAVGEMVGGAMENLLGDILLEELHDRLIEEDFPSISGPASVTVGSWVYDNTTGLYTIIITLADAEHCSEEVAGECVEPFSANGTVTVSVDLDSPPDAPVDLAGLMAFLDAVDSDEEVISVVGRYTAANVTYGESLAISGTLENHFYTSGDEASGEERYEGNFFGQITFNSEGISLMATNCVVMTASGETETVTEVGYTGNDYVDTNLRGNLHLVLTYSGDVEGEAQVITVDLANGTFQAEENHGYADVAFHGGTRRTYDDASSFSCSGTVTVEVADVAGETETELFNLNLELGSLTLANESTSGIDGDNAVYASQMALGLQASLSFTAGAAAFSLEDLDLSFSTNGTSTDYYTEEGSYEGYESSSRIEASLSGALSLMDEGEQVFGIEAPALGAAPNMTLLVESTRANLDEITTSENSMNLHVGRLSIIDHGAEFIYGGDFDFTQGEEGTHVALSLIVTNPAGVTTFMDNYQIDAVDGDPGTEVSVNGTFYHSVYGSVNVTTTGTPFIFEDGGWPVDGALTVTSSNGVAGRLEAMEGQYRVLGDMNGDGDFEDEGDIVGTPVDWPVAPWDMVMSILPMGMSK